MIKKIEKKINKNWIFRNSSETSWYKAQVPGCVHTDLLYNDLIKILSTELMKLNFNGFQKKIGSIKRL